MRILSISLDKALFVKGSESQKRQIAYSSLCEEASVLVLNTGRQNRIRVSDNLEVYPTNSLNRIFYVFDALKLGAKVIKNKDIDLIIVQDPVYTGIIGLVLSMMYRRKLLVGIFGSDIFDPYLKPSGLKRVKKAVGKLALNKANAIQTDGPEVFENLKKGYAGKIFLKPVVPADIDRFRQIEKLSDGQLKVLFVGRMVEQKNIPMLMDVIHKTKTRESNLVFTVIGDGPGKPVMDDSFEYMAKVNRDELAYLFARHDLLISTSFYEGFPKVFMEAAAAGVPIVTTKVSGIKNLIINGKTGFVVAQKDVSSFVDTILYLQKNRGILEQMSRNIREVFDNNFSFKINLNKQAEIFDYLRKLQ